MNDFDKPVEKATTESGILDAMQGVKTMQQEIMKAAREGMHSVGVALAFFKAYYDKLPEDVASRLTEIDPEAVSRIPAASGMGLSGDSLKRYAAKIASPAASAQVIRAANSYRAKLRLGPLGPDGWPEEGGGT